MDLRRGVLAAALAGALALSLETATPLAQSGLVFQTSFDCAEWSQGAGDPCAANDGIAAYGGWTTNTGDADQITSAANNPLGNGRGFRHKRGAGTNNNGGSLLISIPTTSHLWIRFYMRYSAGFQFSGGNPHYTKEIFWNPGEPHNIIMGFSNGTLYTYVADMGSNPNVTSSDTWSAVNQGSMGDGQWHAYEQYMNLNTGQLRMWRDGRLVLDRSGVNFGATSFRGFILSENQSEVIGNHYTDYDDIAISTTGYIGPLGGGGSSNTTTAPLPPQNLRIVS
jgi:hypothetical protein